MSSTTSPSGRAWVWLFREGHGEMRDLLGGKGAGVAEMTRAGLPVPPGFTITTEACRAYYDGGRAWPPGCWEESLQGLKEVESALGRRLGDPDDPLLVSVRSGARFSMPGMMDTILNLGLNDSTVLGLARRSGDERFAWDAYRRFIQMFGRTARGIGVRGDDGAETQNPFEAALERTRHAAGVSTDAEIPAPALRDLAGTYLGIYRDALGEDFPQAPEEQLRQAVEAVFRSWHNRRAHAYREREGIPHDLGTAVNVQAMVFGNMGEGSGTGVAFTRDPNTGEARLYGDYLANAQGEDVVAGIRQTESIDALGRDFPEVARQFGEIAATLERHYRDMQDLEFTVERGRLWMLQTRTGKRTAQAAVRIAVDMVGEGLISREEALLRVEARQVEQLMHPQIDPAATNTRIARGVPAAPGAAHGKAVFDADRADALGRAGEDVILVRVETNPDDVHGMIAARGVLTQTGGTASHAAVVARGMGKPCVVGAAEVQVDTAARLFQVNGTTVREGEEITIDGSTGSVYAGRVPTVESRLGDEVETLLGWADQHRRLEVWANADYPRDAQVAREHGAQGVGLCRTEHMFMEPERLHIVQRMILATEESESRALLDQLLPFQRGDFEGVLEAMDGLPVVIRLIDPPLHEFLPIYEDLLVEVTRDGDSGVADEAAESRRALMRRVASMRESNPMLGLRGVRLGLVRPEITEMQVRAIFEAAINLKRRGLDPRPEIMVPLVGHVNEIRLVRERLESVAKTVMSEAGVDVHYKFGTMIEVPRGALTAGAIAEYAEFFSFGTNDLTQTTFGYSRDDAEGRFLLTYLDQKILAVNPFESIDRDGVGRLMRIAVEEGRAARPGLEIGICGEHGGDPDSIEFCHQLGLDYVSCSPYRVPVARLAAARAALSAEAIGTTA
ncbi:MAG: pyruvate, phosphate dikinase [Candidatus Dormibacteria bacterium]